MAHQATNTRSHIIETATRIFAEKGYEGARVDEIAKAADVNKATLYYQVGDKTALYQAGITLFLARTAEQVEAAVNKVDACEEKIRCFIKVIAQNSGALEFSSRIILREVAAGGRHLPDEALPYMARILGVLGNTLTKGENLGQFRPVNHFFVHMMIIGSLMLYAVNAPIRRRMTALLPAEHPGTVFLTPEEAAVEVSQLVLAAIRAPHQEDTQP
jgi:AcrR family transcriptional regulator